MCYEGVCVWGGGTNNVDMFLFQRIHVYYKIFYIRQCSELTVLVS